MRVDEQMVALNLSDSLEMARRLVMEGRVYQGEERVAKPSDLVRRGFPLILREGRPYVSRGAKKLIKALDAFDISVESKVCVDIGASTGGFTDALLKRGAARVYAVDVGYGLLDWKLRNDARTVVMERTNARFLRPEQFDPPPSFGAADVSFISLKAIMPAAFSILAHEAACVALIKPQFEAKPEYVKKGVVRDRSVHEQVISDIARFVARAGWTPAKLIPSPIRGAKGNVEFLLLILPGETGAAGVTDEEICLSVREGQDVS